MEVQPDDSGRSREKRDILQTYLQEELEEGNHYFKSKQIAANTDLSPNQVGALFSQLQESASGLTIEKWSYSSATTWRVERE